MGGMHSADSAIRFGRSGLGTGVVPVILIVIVGCVIYDLYMCLIVYIRLCISSVLECARMAVVCTRMCRYVL